MKIKKKQIISWSLLIILTITVWIVRCFPLAGEFYARSIYPAVAATLSAFSSLFPFSLGDLFILTASLYILIRLIQILWERQKICLQLLNLLTLCGWIYLWFYLAWGLNYFRQDFYTRTQIPRTTYTTEKFKTFLTDYITQLNDSYTAENHTSPDTITKEIQKEYGQLPAQFGITPPSAKMKAKHMLSSTLMSKMGISGYMGPFFTEFNLNKDLLPSQYPFTYAHEAAHRLGIAGEAEANLYAWLVCTRSGNPAIKYSGNLAIMGYVLNNASRLLTEQEFKKLLGEIRPEIIEQYKSDQTYWRQKYSPLIGRIQNNLYNLFLKSNRIPSGTKNYSEVVALIISYQNSRTRIPATHRHN